MLYDGPTRLTLLQAATTAAAIPPPLDVVGLAFRLRGLQEDLP